MAAKTAATKGVRERKPGVAQHQSFEVEFTTDLWRIIQKEGKFNLNEDGDPAKRVEIALINYDIEEVPVEEREWSSDTEQALKQTTTVFLRFDRKKGA